MYQANIIPNRLIFLILFLFFTPVLSVFSQYYPFYSNERNIESHSFYENYENLIARYNDGAPIEEIIKDIDSLASISLEKSDYTQYLFLKNETSNLYKHNSRFIKAHNVLHNSMKTFKSGNDTINIEYFVSLRLLRSTLLDIRNTPGKSGFEGRDINELFQAQFDVLDALGEDGEPMRNVLVDYGLALFREGKNRQATQNLYHARTLALEANDLASLAIADYTIISNMKSSYDLLETKHEVLKNDIALFESNPASIPIMIYKSFFLTTVSRNYYYDFNNTEQAIKHAERAAALLAESQYPSYNIVANTHGNLSMYYADIKDTTQLWTNVNKARDILKTKPMSDYNRALAYVLITDAVIPVSTDSAFTYLSIINTLPGKHFFDDKLAEVNAKAHLEKGNPGKAAEIILSVFEDYDIIEGQKVPVISSNIDYINQFYFLEILEEAYRNMENQSEYTPAIVSIYSRLNSLFHNIVTEDIYGFETTGLADIYDGFLKKALHYMLDPERDDYFDERMQLAFSSKAIHLNNLMAKNRYQTQLESDTTLFSRLLESSREVQNSRNLLATADPSDEENLYEMQMNLNSNLIDYLMLRYDINETYRNEELAMFRDNIEIASWSDIQSQLMDNEALIEYFVMENSWSQILVLPDTVICLYNEGTGLKQEIEKEQFALLTGRNTTGLGEVLFDGLIPYLDKIDKLVIVPDKNLSFIPFEWLEINNKMLIEDYSISYSYSASLWYNLRQDDKYIPPDNMLTVAPFLTASMPGTESQFISHYRGDEQLEGLTFSLEEVSGIGSIMQNRLTNIRHLKAENASLSNVIKHLPNYDIVHFATHGLANPDYPERSGLFLYQEQDSGFKADNTGFLSLGELFNMNLNAGLMVLSACNTGSGAFKEGEGVIALPRGFILSGVPKVLASLWRVHDERTKDIMLLFYQHLADGHEYREALRLAKLDAIEQGFIPLDWAGFVLIGN